MSLIKCPECKRDVSDSATICPHCGYQLKVSQGTAIFKCADNGGWNTAWIKRTVDLIDNSSGKIIKSFQMGGAVSIPVNKNIYVKIHVHGYIKQPVISLQPGRNVYVNITLHAGGALGGGFCSAEVVNMGVNSYSSSPAHKENDSQKYARFVESSDVLVKCPHCDYEFSVDKDLTTCFCVRCGTKLVRAIDDEEENQTESIPPRKKGDFHCEDKIVVISDIEINGKTIKKGTEGTIDNVLRGSQGVTFIVIFDDPNLPGEFNMKADYLELRD